MLSRAVTVPLMLAGWMRTGLWVEVWPATRVTVTVVGGDPLRPEVLVEIPLLHLVHLTAAISALLPVRSVIRPAALVAPARRFVLVQVAVFAVVAVAEVLPTGRNTTVVELAGLRRRLVVLEQGCAHRIRSTHPAAQKSRRPARRSFASGRVSS